MSFPRIATALLVLALSPACAPAAQPAPTTAPAPTKPIAAPAAASPSPAVSPSPVTKPGPLASPAASPSPSPSPSPAAGLVTTELRDGAGQIAGTATFTQEAGGVRVAAQVRNLPPGTHGIHVHEVGRCDPPDFMSAGGHFNPTSRQHGLRNPNGPHAGDLPNLEIGADGTGRLNALARDLSVGAGTSSVFDTDGSALVIHAAADDEATDPSGNSGGRIACGIIRRG